MTEAQSPATQRSQPALVWPLARRSGGCDGRLYFYASCQQRDWSPLLLRLLHVLAAAHLTEAATPLEEVLADLVDLLDLRTAQASERVWCC